MLLNNITIFNGVDFEIKARYDFVDYSFKRDLTQRATSTIKLIDKFNVIKLQDLFVIKNFMNSKMVIAGKILEISLDEKEPLQKELTLVYGVDTHDNTFRIEEPTEPWIVLNVDNQSPFNIHYAYSAFFWGDKGEVQIDALLREIQRYKETSIRWESEQPVLFFKEEYTISQEGINLSLVEYSVNELEKILESVDVSLNRKVVLFKLRYNDPNIIDVSIDTSTKADTYNKIILYQDGEDIFDQTNITMYLKEDGSTSLDEADAVKPIKETVEFVSEENFTTSYAADKLQTNSYDHKIELTTKINNQCEALELNNTILGRPVRITLPDNTVIYSRITAYEINNELTMKITLGLNRDKLSDKINIDKGV